jgi:hypothetical protein
MRLFVCVLFATRVPHFVPIFIFSSQSFVLEHYDLISLLVISKAQRIINFSICTDNE